MESIIRYAIDRPRLNYAFAIILFLAGVYSYFTIPKEIFPSIALDKIIIQGSYAGASADNLDKMAVTDIEDEITSISGIKQVESTVTAGAFNIIATLKENSDEIDVLGKVKDSISLIVPDLPSDMNEPTAQIMERKIPLMQVAVASDALDDESLMNIAKEIKSELSKIPNLTDVFLYGESDKQIEIRLDSRKIDAYGLDKSALVQAISQISYIYPIGKIEGQGRHLYVSTVYGKQTRESLLSTILKVGGKTIYLRDVADARIAFAERDTRSTYNGEKSLTINIAKDEQGNAIQLSRDIKTMLKSYEQRYDNVRISYFSDTSIYIKNRLTTVNTNITFGFILVTISMLLLINFRISLVVAAGIPFSFMIGVIFFAQGGYSLNMTSLLGALIAIGVLVDDAIIVAENIQRHIEEGMEPRQAAIDGAKEVATPVILATLTTMFAFFPMLMMTGEMGEFIKMIPIAVILLILASWIESFFFLPLHSRHLLKKDAPTLSWKRVNNGYVRIIRFLLRRKRLSLLFFLVFIPLATVIGFSQSKFIFFPEFDANELYIKGRLNVNTDIDETYQVIRNIEQEVLAHKKEMFVKSTSAIAGFLMSDEGDSEIADNVFMIFIELEEPKPDNFVSRYIQPVLTLDFDDSEQIRDQQTFRLEKKLQQILAGTEEKYHMEEFSVTAPGPGVFEWDVELQLISQDEALITTAITRLQSELKQMQGISLISDDADRGIAEFKLRINRYGEQLGVTETILAEALSDYFLFAKRGRSFNQDGIMEIKTEDIRKDDLDTLKRFRFALSDGRQVQLSEVVDFEVRQTYEKIIKENGDKMRSVFANVDKEVVTASEILKQLEPTIGELQESGLTIQFGGEKEQNEQLKHDMMVASFIALALMFLSLIFMFDSIKYTLMILSIIPFSFLGVTIGHFIMSIPLTMPSVIGILGLAGVVINDGIVMLDFIRKTDDLESLLKRAAMRFRPVVLTSVTTLLGLSTLIFFPSGQAVILQPLAISLGFGLFWGTILNLLYLPTLYAVVNRIPVQRNLTKVSHNFR